MYPEIKAPVGGGAQPAKDWKNDLPSKIDRGVIPADADGFVNNDGVITFTKGGVPMNSAKYNAKDGTIFSAAKTSGADGAGNNGKTGGAGGNGGNGNGDISALLSGGGGSQNFDLTSNFINGNYNIDANKFMGAAAGFNATTMLAQMIPFGLGGLFSQGSVGAALNGFMKSVSFNFDFSSLNFSSSSVTADATDDEGADAPVNTDELAQQRGFATTDKAKVYTKDGKYYIYDAETKEFVESDANGKVASDESSSSSASSSSSSSSAASSSSSSSAAASSSSSSSSSAATSKPKTNDLRLDALATSGNFDKDELIAVLEKNGDTKPVIGNDNTIKYTYKGIDVKVTFNNNNQPTRILYTDTNAKKVSSRIDITYYENGNRKTVDKYSKFTDGHGAQNSTDDNQVKKDGNGWNKHSDHEHWLFNSDGSLNAHQASDEGALAYSQKRYDANNKRPTINIPTNVLNNCTTSISVQGTEGGTWSKNKDNQFIWVSSDKKTTCVYTADGKMISKETKDGDRYEYNDQFVTRKTASQLTAERTKDYSESRTAVTWNTDIEKYGKKK